MKQNQAHDNYRPGDSYKNSSFTVQSQYYWLHNLSISHLTHPSTKLHLHTHLLSVQVYRVACKEWEGKTTDWLTDWLESLHYQDQMFWFRWLRESSKQTAKNIIAAFAALQKWLPSEPNLADMLA